MFTQKKMIQLGSRKAQENSIKEFAVFLCEMIYATHAKCAKKTAAD